MKLKESDLTKITKIIEDEFGDDIPSQKELQEYLIPNINMFGFGAAEAIALAALFYAIWSRWNPTPAQRVPTCQHQNGLNICGQPFLHIEKNGNKISAWCANKHITEILV